MSTQTLKAELRQQQGKEWAKKARAAGKLPGVVYGPGFQALSVVLDTHAFSVARKATVGEQVLLNLELDNGGRERVFVKDVQRDPVTAAPLHVDLFRVDPTRPVHLNVRLRVVGSIPAGVRDGGMLERARNQIAIEALADSVPAHIDVDLSELTYGKSLHVSDLPALPGVTYMDPADTPLFSIVGKAKEEVPAAAAAAAATPAAAPAAS